MDDDLDVLIGDFNTLRTVDFLAGLDGVARLNEEGDVAVGLVGLLLDVVRDDDLVAFIDGVDFFDHSVDFADDGLTFRCAAFFLFLYSLTYSIRKLFS